MIARTSLVLLGVWTIGGPAYADPADPPTEPAINGADAEPLAGAPTPPAATPVPDAVPTATPSSTRVASSSPPVAVARSRVRWAVGVGLGASPQTDGTWGLQPELVGHASLRLAPRWSVRGGVRAWFHGVNQPEMAQGLGLVERDLGGSVELAVSYRAPVVPTLTIAGMVARRSISLDAASEIDTSGSMLDHVEVLPGIYGQLGVGLPVGKRFMLEPYLRFEWVPDDRRTQLGWGMDISMVIGR